MSTDKELKVSSLVNFTEEDWNLANITISKLDVLTKEYSELEDAVDPNVLDSLKRRFLAHMSTLTSVYSKVKAFKGANHSYLEDARKQFKAEALNILIKDEGAKVTEAKESVYAHEYYKERIRLTERIREFFIKVDEYHEFFSGVLNLMQQTISIVSKDYEYNRYSKN